MANRDLTWLDVGDRVMIDSVEGFGGPAVVVEKRESPHNKFRVRMDGDPIPPFWAHDQEVTPADSRPATREHIEQVRVLMKRVLNVLWHRLTVHDASKLESPEREIFDEFTPKLAACTYGSDEYKGYLAAMKPALDHHYAANSHHPEHYPDGVKGMSLLDLIEMLCDWKAATLRHRDGDIRLSVEINQKRFGYSDELKGVFLNTIADLERGS